MGAVPPKVVATGCLAAIDSKAGGKPALQEDLTIIGLLNPADDLVGHLINDWVEH
jgi:hypothetical protein